MLVVTNISKIILGIFLRQKNIYISLGNQVGLYGIDNLLSVTVTNIGWKFVTIFYMIEFFDKTFAEYEEGFDSIGKYHCLTHQRHCIGTEFTLNYSSLQTLFNESFYASVPNTIK